MKWFISLTAIAVTGLALVSADAFDDRKSTAARQTQKQDKAAQPSKKADKADAANTWMKAKQRHAHEIFDGLTEGDFEKIDLAARTMFMSGVIEKWLGGPEYQDHHAYEGQLNAFEYSLKELARHAKAKDVDGALHAYVMMSQSCVRCHRLIRDDGDKKAVKKSRK